MIKRKLIVKFQELKLSHSKVGNRWVVVSVSIYQEVDR